MKTMKEKIEDQEIKRANIVLAKAAVSAHFEKERRKEDNDVLFRSDGAAALFEAGLVAGFLKGWEYGSNMALIFSWDTAGLLTESMKDRFMAAATKAVLDAVEFDVEEARRDS